jgi:beta-lactamase superfamily II metal-dependent hydrolase
MILEAPSCIRTVIGRVAAAWIVTLVCLVVPLESASAAAARNTRSLAIYFIDVEGGQSTLVVTPDRHSLLIDTGWAGDGSGFHPGEPRQARDANRIVAAARDAGIRQIDYLLITHFHMDHDGGVRELAQLLPINTFVDHGSPSADVANAGVEQNDAFVVYSAVRSGSAHLQPRPGEHLPLKEVEVTVVSSAGATLTKPLPNAGRTNEACPNSAPPPRDPNENPRSTGVVIRYGKFRFLDMGDLTGQPLFDLVCPRDMIGPVDAYLVAHHGGTDAADLATFAALKPRVAIMNNGLKKGGALVTYQALHQVPGLEDVWQLHLSAEAGVDNFPAKTVANLDESTAHWIKLIANSDGSFRVFNQRTGESKEYTRRSR